MRGFEAVDGGQGTIGVVVGTCGYASPFGEILGGGIIEVCIGIILSERSTLSTDITILVRGAVYVMGITVGI